MWHATVTIVKRFFDRLHGGINLKPRRATGILAGIVVLYQVILVSVVGLHRAPWTDEGHFVETVANSRMARTGAPPITYGGTAQGAHLDTLRRKALP